jgi:hypothetical protein
MYDLLGQIVVKISVAKVGKCHTIFHFLRSLRHPD